MKTIEIPIDRLTDFLIDACPHHHHYGENNEKPYCYAKFTMQCKARGTTPWECPPECPRLKQDNGIGCDGAKCHRIKRQLKYLKTGQGYNVKPT